MSKTNRLALTYIELHNPLFLAGTNLSAKLDPNKKTGLEMEFDTSLDAAVVQYKGEVALVPSSNISSMTVENPPDIGVDKPKQKPLTVSNKSHPMVANIDAQVETPISGRR